MVDKIIPADLASLELAGYQPDQIKQAARPLIKWMRHNGVVAIAVTDAGTSATRTPEVRPLVNLMRRHGIAAVSLVFEQNQWTANVHLRGQS